MFETQTLTTCTVISTCSTFHGQETAALVGVGQQGHHICALFQEKM